MSSENVQSSMNCVVIQLQRELDELLGAKALIKKRMRILRRNLSSLQGEMSPGIARRKYRYSESLVRRKEVGKMRQLQQELHRACRIAFLELGGTATADALYSAIARRGSFSFAEIKQKPTIAILRALTFMAQSGEITCSRTESEPKWTYNSELSTLRS